MEQRTTECDLFEVELSRHDWASLRTIGGPATAIPRALTMLMNATNPDQASDAFGLLDNHVVVQGQLFECALAVTSVLMAAIPAARSRFIRIQIFELLFQIVHGEADESEALRGLPDLGERCRAEARLGLWSLYRELGSAMVEAASDTADPAAEGNAEASAELLEILDPDSSRLRHFREVVSRRCAKSS